MADKSNDPVAMWQNMIGEMEKGFNSLANQAMVSPEFTRSTGGWALSNQPHWVVSSVAGNKCIVLPFGKFTTRSRESAGPTPG